MAVAQDTRSPDAVDISASLDAARQHLRAYQLEAAEGICRAVLRSDPGNAPALHLLGRIAYMAGRMGVSLALIERAIAADPCVSAFYSSRGLTCLRLWRLRDAVASFERAIEVDPQNAKAFLNLGAANLARGEVGEAVGSFREAIRLDPELDEARSNLLFALHYDPEINREALAAQAREWGRGHPIPPEQAARGHPNQPNPHRRLRVGYVSADFRNHPVGYFLEPVLAAHDRESVEVYCYSNHPRADDLTSRLRGLADHWQGIAGVDDDTVGDLIRADAIDILVDLSGHTLGNRLGVFAQKPAPVQATWIGYFDTTGLPTIDYLLADNMVCPPAGDGYHVEQVVRLPESYLCFAPRVSVDVSPPPVLRQGHVTFGCFNRVAKINPAVIALWAEILRRRPEARLCLKDGAFGDPIVRERLISRFATHGIDSGRLDLYGGSLYPEYLSSYRLIDIVLDTFPFNSGTTAVEALWMGVPLVTLTGDRLAGRMATSHLQAVGLGDLAAAQPEDYVRTAIALADDVDRLVELRQTLRQRFTQSALGNGRRFTGTLEAAYRQMWKRWCQVRRAGS